MDFGDHPAGSQVGEITFRDVVLLSLAALRPNVPIMLQFDEQQLSVVRSVLLGKSSEVMRRLMFELALNTALTDSSCLQLAREYGWVEPSRLVLTPLGRAVGDPLREYQFWLDRDRMLPGADLMASLGPETYRNKTVLEVGSSCGCNLLSLQGVAKRAVGAEPMTAYRQMAPIIAELAGLPKPEIVAGLGRELPFDANQFDVVLCCTSHQYMDINLALPEMCRVLKPGGELRIVGNTLGPFCKETVETFAKNRSLGYLKYHLVSILNTLVYQSVQRRVVGGGASTTTSTPIYPTRRFMQQSMLKFGLSLDTSRLKQLPSGESTFFATRL